MRFFRRETLALVDGLLSDALGERYGPITARVLKHDDREREAHLVDLKGVTRTYSITFLSRPMPAGLRELNREIRAGALMGETFRKRGFTIRKIVFDIFVVESPAWLRNNTRISRFTRVKVASNVMAAAFAAEPPFTSCWIFQITSAK